MNDKVVIAKEEEVNLLLFPSILQWNMIIMTTDSTLLGKIKNRFEADSRCMLRNIKEHLLKAIKDVLE